MLKLIIAVPFMVETNDYVIIGRIALTHPVAVSTRQKKNTTLTTTIVNLDATKNE